MAAGLAVSVPVADGGDPQSLPGLPVEQTFRPEMVDPKEDRCIVSLCRVFPRKAPLEEAAETQVVIFGTLRLQPSQVGKI
ncbi:MAG: hypothetical protein F6K39_00085 [Okeania sp. SIO3B3]|nr:hypothetical protein [Okeania sp. SIO3B3]